MLAPKVKGIEKYMPQLLYFYVYIDLELTYILLFVSFLLHLEVV